MAQAVTIVDSGGFPVTNTSSLLAGTPMTPVDAGGMAVTLVDSGGYPVCLIEEDGTLWAGATYSAEAQQYFDRITDPGPTIKGVIDTWITTWVADGTWAQLIGLYIDAPDAASHYQNVRQNLYNGTATLGDYIPTKGWRGTGSVGNSGTASYIDTGFTPSTDGGSVMTLNSAHFGEWIVNGCRGLQGSGAFTGTSGMYLFPGYANTASIATTFNATCNDATDLSVTGIVSTSGHFGVNRSASNAKQSYKDGASVGTATTASVSLPNRTLRFGAINAASVPHYSRRVRAACHWGGSLTAPQWASLYAGLSAIRSAYDASSYQMAAFTNVNENMFWATSRDGVTFIDQGVSYAKTPDAGYRDPKPRLHTDGYLYTAYTNVSGAVGANQNSSFSTNRSTDGGVTWTRVGAVDCSNLTGGVGLGHLYVDNWFEESGVLYLVINWSDDANSPPTNMRLGYVQVSDLGANSWGTPTAITGTVFSSVTNCIEGMIHKKASTYYLFAKDETTRRIIVMTSTSPFSGYDTRDTTMETAINNAMENISAEGGGLINITGDWYRFYIDAYESNGVNECFLETFDYFTTWELKARVSQSAIATSVGPRNAGVRKAS